MRTTLNLPDDLLRAIKVRAAEQNRKLQDVVAELLRRGLAYEPPSDEHRRVSLPLIQCARESELMTPDRVAEILEAQDAQESLR